ncbi:MAG: hybrid sensor histidine kinase/response regulator [Candidatus Anammoxibacter sp.]
MENKSGNQYPLSGVRQTVSTILIIDDEQVVIDSVRKDLKEDGYEIISAMNGKEGLEIYEKEHPILIILDIRMPVMDGIGFLKNMKFKHPDPLPVIILTGYGDNEAIKNCFDLGVFSFLEKPYNPYVLKRAVSHAIELKNIEMESKRLASFPRLNINPILEVDLSGAIIFYNKAAIDVSEKLGINGDVSVFLPEDINEIIKSLEQKKDMQLFREIEIGSLTFEENIHFIREFNVVRIYTRNITERKGVEKELRRHREYLEKMVEERTASEGRFINLLSAIPDIVYKIDVNGNFMFVNDAIRKLGYEPTELIGKHFSKIVHPDDVDAVSRAIVLPISAGKKTGDKDQSKLFAERRTGKRSTTELELRLVTKTAKETQHNPGENTGKDIIIGKIDSAGIYEINIDTGKDGFVGSYGVIKGKDDGFSGTAGVMRDVTERKRIEKQLLKLTTAVEQSPSVVLITDKEGHIEYVNPKFTDITGYTVEEAIGKTPRILKSGMLSHETYKQLWSTITSGNEWQGDLHNRKKNGELYWEAAYIAPIKDTEGVVTNYIKVAEDITHRKSIEDELMRSQCELEERVAERTCELEATHEQLIHSEKLSAIGKLSASIAHEFNNPIFGILNILERLRDDVPMDEANKDFVKLAIGECDRISDLIKKLQDFYRPSTDKMVLMDIHEIIEDVLMLMQKKLKLKKIELIKDYTPKTSIIKVVPDQIKQVLLNVLNNAEQAIPDGGGKIYISIENHKTAIKINIHDTGVGIKDKDMKSIFEPFYSTKAIKGSGLGLSVSYGIIKHHGGDIKVKSRPGKGTTFSITLPPPVARYRWRR